MTIPNKQQRIDEGYMSQALTLAENALHQGEVPVGAIVVLGERTLGVGENRCEMDHDPSAHAEVIAIKAAARQIGASRLDGATLYVTLEPCLMCCGILLQARIARLVFGAREPRTGGVVSIHDALRLPGVTHHVAITEGVHAEQSAAMMHRFFQNLRQPGSAL